MEELEVGLRITNNGEQVTKSVKSIKTELREATQEAFAFNRKFGEFSPEAEQAKDKLAKLKNEVADFGDQVDALNPDRKFQAVTKSLQGVAGGFAGVQGAIGLFGAESEDLQKQLLKVQSALALSEGINSILEAQDSFKNLGVLIKGNVTKAFGSLRSAIISTGIGALVIGVALLIANFDTVKKVVLNFIPGLAKVGEFVGKLVNKITDFVGVTSEAERAYEKLKKSASGQNDELDRQIKLLQAQGGQEEKIAKLQKQKIDNQIAVSKANKNKKDEDIKNEKDLENEKKVIDLEEKKRLEDKKKTEAKERADAKKERDAEAKQKRDEIKKQTYESDKELALAKLEGREKEKKQLEFERAEALKAVEGNAVATQNVKDLYKIKEADLNKQFAEEDKKTAEELEEFKNQLYLDSITNEELRAEKESQLALEKKLKDINDSKLSAVEKKQAVQDAVDAWQFEQDAKDFEAQLKKDAEAIAKTEGDFENDLVILDAQRQAIVNNTKLTEEKRTKLLDENTKARMSIEDLAVEHKKKQVNETIGLLSNLGAIVGQQTAAGKALAIATALINTYQGASEALKEKSTLPAPFSTIARFAAAGAIIANGIRTVKQITSVKVPGGGGGGGVSGGGANPISGTAPVTAPIAQGVSVQQTAVTNGVNIKNTDAIKAYVVERDITDSQDRINKIKSAATFGG